ncbi:MAG: hypothetical protein V1798_00255 [Pseudomonadota bacterium]
MRLRKISLRVLFALSFAFGLMSRWAIADEPVREPRQGFFLGFDVGGGGITLNGLDRGAFLGGIKIGGGVSEKVLLMGETSGAATSIDGDTVGISGIYFATQWFFADNFYVRPGVGFAVLRTASGHISAESDAGFSAAAAVGYEFRLTKRFAMSPEAKGSYARIQGGNVGAYGAALDLRWYL